MKNNLNKLFLEKNSSKILSFFGVSLILFSVLNPITSYAVTVGESCPVPITEYPTITENSAPQQIVSASNGSIWFTEEVGSSNSPLKIGQISTSGAVSEYALPNTGSGSGVSDIVSGLDASAWFSLKISNSTYLGHITGLGQITLTNLPSNIKSTGGMISNNDGSFWISARGVLGNNNFQPFILNVTETGETIQIPITTLPDSPNGVVNSIVKSTVDGSIWFLYVGNGDGSVNRIGRLDPLDNGITWFNISGNYNNGSLVEIAQSTDGSFWFTGYINNAGYIGHLTSNGDIVQYTNPKLNGLPYGITLGNDGNMWFTHDSSQIGTINTTNFNIDLYNLQTTIQPITPRGITKNVDGSIWLTEMSASKIARINSIPSISSPDNFSAPVVNRVPNLSWSTVSNANLYLVCRDGQIIGSSSTPSFIDASGVTGSHYYSVIAQDGQGDTSYPSFGSEIYVSIDQTPPAISSIRWSANPLQQGANTTLYVVATDDQSVNNLNYSINGGTPSNMTFNDNTGEWEATFGSNLPVNTYDINISAQDSSGNISEKTDVLAIYNASNGYVTGHASVLPDINDVLPINLDTSLNNPTKLLLGLTNVKAATLNTSASGSFDVHYTIKNNKNEFSLSSTNIDSLVVSDINHASVFGKATLIKYENGIKTTIPNVSVRIDLITGISAIPDFVTIKIYNPGLSYNDNPTWHITKPAIANNTNIVIKP